MKLLSAVLAFIAILGCQKPESHAKFVFYFIGDGMGLAQVSLAEAYLADSKGKIALKPLVSLNSRSLVLQPHSAQAILSPVLLPQGQLLQQE